MNHYIHKKSKHAIITSSSYKTNPKFGTEFKYPEKELISRKIDFLDGLIGQGGMVLTKRDLG